MIVDGEDICVKVNSQNLNLRISYIGIPVFLCELFADFYFVTVPQPRVKIRTLDFSMIFIE